MQNNIEFKHRSNIRHEYCLVNIFALSDIVKGIYKHSEDD